MSCLAIKWLELEYDLKKEVYSNFFVEQYAPSNKEITILKNHAQEFQKCRETETQRYKTIKIIKILGCYCIVTILKKFF